MNSLTWLQMAASASSATSTTGELQAQILAGNKWIHLDLDGDWQCPATTLEDQGTLSTEAASSRRGMAWTCHCCPTSRLVLGFPLAFNGEWNKGYHDTLQGGTATPMEPLLHRQTKSGGISPKPKIPLPRSSQTRRWTRNLVPASISSWLAVQQHGKQGGHISHCAMPPTNSSHTSSHEPLSLDWAQMGSWGVHGAAPCGRALSP